MAVLNSAADILSLDDNQLTKIKVPMWGNKEIFIKCLTVKEMAAVEKYSTKADGSMDGAKYIARMVVACVANKDGEQLFNEGHIDALQNKNASALNFIVEKALSLNNVNDDVEALAKN